METVTKHIGATQKDRDDGQILQYAKENGMTVVTDDKRFMNRLKVNMVPVITVGAVDKARVIREKISSDST